MSKQRMTIEQLIIKAKSIHGDKYDYSKVCYGEGKINIICPKHGEFKQTVSSHIYCGSGCRECGLINKKLSVEEFKEKAGIKYNNRFDYSKISFTKTTDSCIIYCNKHNYEFIQTIDEHLNRYCGCKYCSKEGRADKTKVPLDIFISKAKSIHGNKYNYFNVHLTYNNSTTKVDIFCNIHNKYFSQSPNKHLSGRGCPDCADDKRRIDYSFTTSQFISKAKSIHGDKYDYSKSVYVNSNTKIIIICLKHNKKFIQYAGHHLRGFGCKLCGFENITFSTISKEECKWIESLNISKENKQYHISYEEFDFDNQVIKNKFYYFDGYDHLTNTLYEYQGLYYHGYPGKYNQWDFNKKTHCTYGELYNKTLIKRMKALEFGYNIIENWSDEQVLIFKP